MAASDRARVSTFETLALRSARRPWITIGIWVLVLLIGVALRVTLFDDAITTEFAPTSNPDSKRADDLIEDRLSGPKGTNEVIIVRSETLTVDAPAFQGFVEELFGKVASLGPEVIKPETFTNYYLT